MNKRKVIIIVIILAVIIIIGFGLNWILILQKAHSTFENYYSFRGCHQLLEKTDNYGTCRISDDKIIKIVKFQGKWYLDGDLPCGFLCF
jgi:hypothetical protein